MFTFLGQEDWYHLLISRTPMALTRALNMRFKELNMPISKEQFSILVVLWKKEGCSQQFLSEQTFRDKPGVTRLIDNLEREGLVVRKPDPYDRRSNLIYLTEKGKEIEQEVTEAVREVIGKSLENITEEDVRVVKRVLDTFYANLDSFTK